MRSKVELLKLLRKELKEQNVHMSCGGLCSLIVKLLDCGVITVDERHELKYLIYSNTPKDSCGLFFFPIGEREPRDKFLKELIEKYEHD